MGRQQNHVYRSNIFDPLNGANHGTKTVPHTISIELIFFGGSVHCFHKFSRALTESSAPIRLFLSKKSECKWKSECQEAFENLIVLQIDVHKDIRIVCDDSHKGLGAVLEQLGTQNWRPISFAKFVKIASIAENCREGFLADKNMETLCNKGDIEKIPEPRVTNEVVQIVFGA